MSMIWVWLIVIVVAVILESISPIQLVSIWAALGGIAALAAVTILMIALTRPLARKLTKFKKTATNADMNIGKIGKVTKIVDEDLGVFRVKVENNDWSATTEAKTVLPVGTEISVLRIEGVKLIVAPVNKPKLAKV